jgi:ligand-binding SRPBCC domain-containing protein
MVSTAHTNETVVGGQNSGLCNVGATITWRAKHFGIYQQLTVRIIACDFPNYFEDQMVSGAFKSFTHRHYFKTISDHTVMEDEFEYQVPFGIAGRCFDKMVLRNYMQQLLIKRNETIQEYAESNKWRRVLPDIKSY